MLHQPLTMKVPARWISTAEDDAAVQCWILILQDKSLGNGMSPCFPILLYIMLISGVTEIQFLWLFGVISPLQKGDRGIAELRTENVNSTNYF